MNVPAALNILNAVLSTAAQISTLLSQAQAEGRTDFTPEEWALIDKNYVAADAGLTDAIERTK